MTRALSPARWRWCYQRGDAGVASAVTLASPAWWHWHQQRVDGGDTSTVTLASPVTVPSRGPDLTVTWCRRALAQPGSSHVTPSTVETSSRRACRRGYVWSQAGDRRRLAPGCHGNQLDASGTFNFRSQNDWRSHAGCHLTKCFLFWVINGVTVRLSCLSVRQLWIRGLVFFMSVSWLC